MRIFKDVEGREWKIKITLGAIKNVRETLGIDLLNPASSSDGDVSTLVTMMQDDVLIASVVAELLKNQFEKSETTTGKFLDALDGSETKRLVDVFFEEYSYFFSERGLDVWVETIASSKKAMKEALVEAMEKLKSIGTKYAESQESQD